MRVICGDLVWSFPRSSISRADWMTGPSKGAFSTSQSSLFGPSQSLWPSASGSTLFATSTSTLFGAVSVGSSRNIVRYRIYLSGMAWH